MKYLSTCVPSGYGNGVGDVPRQCNCLGPTTGSRYCPCVQRQMAEFYKTAKCRTVITTYEVI